MAKLNGMHLVTEAALRGFLGPQLAMDQKVDLKPIVSGLTGANYRSRKAGLKTAVEKATQGKLAQDGDLGNLAQMLDTLDDVATAVAAEIEDKDVAEDETEEEKKERERKEKEAKDKAAKDTKAKDTKAKDENDDETEEEKKERERERKEKEAKDKAAKDAKDDDKVSQPAMDAAIAAAKAEGAKLAEDAAVKRFAAIRQAEALVRPYIGELKEPLTSASAVLKLALDANNVDLTGVPESAYGSMLKLVPLPTAAKPDLSAFGGGSAAPVVAMDAKQAKAYDTMFPEAKHLKHR